MKDVIKIIMFVCAVPMVILASVLLFPLSVLYIYHNTDLIDGIGEDGAIAVAILGQLAWIIFLMAFFMSGA